MSWGLDAMNWELGFSLQHDCLLTTRYRLILSLEIDL